MRRLAVLFATLFVPAVLCALPCRAQTVRGELSEPGGHPIEQVVVALLDSAGHQRAGAYTDAAGAFVIRAPAGGRYSLRAERIGYTTVTSRPFALAAGETHVERLVASGRPLALQAITIAAAARRCAVRPRAGLATATLWEEARKALNATAFGQQSRLFRYELESWRRDLEPHDLSVLSDRREARATVSQLPFQSRPAEELGRLGYVQRAPGDSLLFFAPDADVLLSDEFLDDHCFRVAAHPADPSLVGLEFQPAGGRRVAEVAGVLWLDRASAELRRVEYRYVNGPPQAEMQGIGGSVEFSRVAAGRWIVRRWAIRMPVSTLVIGAQGEAAAQDRMRLAAIREAGGEVVSVSAADGTPLAEPAATAVARPVVRGVVWDSLRRAPLAGARVYLSGTAAEATTGADGRYRLEAPAAGAYTLAFAAEDLGPVAAGVRPVSVALAADDSAAVDLAVPGPARVVSALCPDSTLREYRGAVFGRVRGGPRDSLAVVASWSHFSQTARSFAAGTGSLATESDAAGWFVLCGVPAGRDLTLELRSTRREFARAEAAVMRGEALRNPRSVLARELVRPVAGTPLRQDLAPARPR